MKQYNHTNVQALVQHVDTKCVESCDMAFEIIPINYKIAENIVDEYLVSKFFFGHHIFSSILMDILKVESPKRIIQTDLPNERL